MKTMYTQEMKFKLHTIPTRIFHLFQVFFPEQNKCLWSVISSRNLIYMFTCFLFSPAVTENKIILSSPVALFP